MAKFATKIIIPIILVGIFAIVVFIAVGPQELGPEFYIVVLFFAIYVFFFGLAVGENLSSPMKKLLDRAADLSKGNLSGRVYLETKDEFSELANTFNKIAEELEANQEQESNTEKSVGIKVQARTQELEETINALEQKVKNRTIELERLIEESGRLQGDVKNKGVEAKQLRQELDDLKQRVGRYTKPKKEV